MYHSTYQPRQIWLAGIALLIAYVLAWATLIMPNDGWLTSAGTLAQGATDARSASDAALISSAP